MVAPHEDIAGRYSAELDWLAREYARGATLATACTGALLLAESGVLDGEDATTHWGYCEAMTARYPRIRIHPNRALVIAGNGQRLIMAGWSAPKRQCASRGCIYSIGTTSVSNRLRR